MTSNPYADLPRVDDLLDGAAKLVQRHGRTAVRDALRAALDHARGRIADGLPSATTDALVDAATAHLSTHLRVGPRRVVNAAGVIVHTNLGRSPLSDPAIAAMVAAAGYTDLEFDLDTGRRGSRGSHVDALLAEATQAADAMVVNNCAAALVLVLATLAPGRQVVVSRGHLVEIGGSFRLPDIMASSGAILLEVGTTNRTRATDYTQGDDVAALLTVHPSNFSQDGFVTQPTLAELAAVAADRGVPLIHDAGSGLLADSDHPALADEPSMAGSLAAGADLVMASGDKLLGGPQAGLIAGRADLVMACRRHPLARALRVDKLRLAALSATVIDHLSGRGGWIDDRLTDPADLPARTASLALACGGAVAQATTMIGGGSAPGVGVAGPVVRLAHEQPHHLAAGLRRADPPIITRVEDGALVLDLRTVSAADDDHLVAAVLGALAATEGGSSPDGDRQTTGVR